MYGWGYLLPPAEQGYCPAVMPLDRGPFLVVVFQDPPVDLLDP